MFGLLRTLLALMVVAQHLWLRGGHTGIYAVFGFYVISGYLMTLIMHETYGYSSNGQRAFLVNRFLRIYPVYWLAVGFSLLLILAFGSEVTRAYYYLMYLPESPLQWFQNAALAFVMWRPVEAAPILSPATWALTVELFFYALICLGISKTPGRVRIWFLLSLLYVAITFLLDWPWQDRYYPIAAGSLPFSIGAGIYFLSRVARPNADKLARWLMALVLLNAAVWCWRQMSGIQEWRSAGFYMNLALCSWLILLIARGATLFHLPRLWDKTVGDYSYPIYLMHWQVGFIASWWFFGEPFSEFSMRGFVNFLLSCALLVPVCWIALRMVDRPIQVIRQRIKSPAMAPA